MKVHITSNDTMQTIYERARAIERSFMDEHYKETGVVWPGRVGIEIVVPCNVWHDFMQMLPADRQHEVIHNKTLMGLLVWRDNAPAPRTAPNPSDQRADQETSHGK